MPKLTVPEMLRPRILESIQKHNRFVMGVMGDVNSPAFMYSIGNHLVGLPEIICVGIHEQAIMNFWCDAMIKKKFAHGDLITWANADVGCRVSVPYDMRDVRENYTVQAGQFYDHQNYDVIQMIIPDKRGRFPGNPLCEAPYSQLPIL